MEVGLRPAVGLGESVQVMWGYSGPPALPSTKTPCSDPMTLLALSWGFFYLPASELATDASTDPATDVSVGGVVDVSVDSIADVSVGVVPGWRSARLKMSASAYSRTPGESSWLLEPPAPSG
jgi:hypothetical protein